MHTRGRVYVHQGQKRRQQSQRYENDGDFALQMRLLPALAYVPLTDVVEAFNRLTESDALPAEAQPVVDYFEDTWIGRPTRRNSRRPPRFQRELWNCYTVKAGSVASLS